MGVGGLATAGVGVAAAGAVGYGVGKYVANPAINWLTSKFVGEDQTLGGLVYELLHREKEPQKVDVSINLKDSEGRVETIRSTQRGKGLKVNMGAGPMMAIP